MRRFDLHSRLAVFGAFSAVLTYQAAAQPPDILSDYRFIPRKSEVHVSGGPQSYNMDLSIAGKFGLVTGYEYGLDLAAHIPTLTPFAQFVDVHAILFNPLSAAPLPVPGWDLDKTLNLTGLDGTFSDTRVLQFTGVDGQGIPIKLNATLRGPLIHLTGNNLLPPTCATCTQYVGYKIDAVGLLRTAADFNADGVVNTADYLFWRKSQPTSLIADDGADVTIGPSDYYDLWRSEFGQTVDSAAGAANSSLANASIPEPATAALLLTAAAALGIGCRQRKRRQFGQPF